MRRTCLCHPSPHAKRLCVISFLLAWSLSHHHHSPITYSLCSPPSHLPSLSASKRSVVPYDLMVLCPSILSHVRLALTLPNVALSQCLSAFPRLELSALIQLFLLSTVTVIPPPDPPLGALHRLSLTRQGLVRWTSPFLRPWRPTRGSTLIYRTLLTPSGVLWLGQPSPSISLHRALATPVPVISQCLAYCFCLSVLSSRNGVVPRAVTVVSSTAPLNVL